MSLGKRKRTDEDDDEQPVNTSCKRRKVFATHPSQSSLRCSYTINLFSVMFVTTTMNGKAIPHPKPKQPHPRPKAIPPLPPPGRTANPNPTLRIRQPDRALPAHPPFLRHASATPTAREQAVLFRSDSGLLRLQHLLLRRPALLAYLRALVARLRVASPALGHPLVDVRMVRSARVFARGPV